MVDTGKIAEVLFESALDTYEQQMQLLDLTTVFSPSSGDMQNAGNVVWRPVQQHAPVIDGWDLTGQETTIIEETYPAILGTPKNDFFSQRADDLRDMQFWERRGKESGRKQATTLNKGIADLIMNTGSLFYRSDATSGYDFIAQAQAILNERQSSKDDRCFILNDRDTLKYSADLAGRQTLQGRPADTWNTGQIGANVAEFDVYTGSFLSALDGGASPGATVTGNQSFAPEGGSVDATTLVVTNVDYRSAVLPISDSSSYTVGDKVTIGAVESVGLADKTSTGQLMTFTIVSIPDGTSIEVYPKPIALDDAALSTLEKAYANVNTTISNTDVVARLNTDASAKSNVFWCKDSIEVTAGDAPIQLLSEFGGMKVVSSQLKSGQTMYMAYDGEIDTLTFKCRIFTWYGLTNANPSANGVAVSF